MSLDYPYVKVTLSLNDAIYSKTKLRITNIGMVQHNITDHIKSCVHSTPILRNEIRYGGCWNLNCAWEGSLV